MTKQILDLAVSDDQSKITSLDIGKNTDQLGNTNRDKNERNAQSSMYYSESLACWIIEGYAEAKEALDSPSVKLPLLPLPPGAFEEEVEVALWPVWNQASQTPLYTSGKRHRELRSRYRRQFTKPQVSRRHKEIEEALDRILSMQGESCEVVEDIAVPLLSEIMLNVIGIPKHNRAQFIRCADAISEVGSVLTSDNPLAEVHRAGSASDELDALIKYLLENPALNGPRSVLSDIVTQSDGGTPSLAEVSIMCRTLYTAGVHTTKLLIANAVYLLFADIDVLAEIQTDDQLVIPYVQEILRFAPPTVEVNIRYAVEDTQIGMHEIKQGEFIRIVLLRAGRDEQRFDDANEFHLKRDDRGLPLGFGLGVHVCLGNHMAAAITESVCRKLAHPSFQAKLISEEPFVVWPATPVYWGPERVRLQFVP